ncbi:MAG: DUF4260 domain-containing protein [Notoacmeibacter sp.]|nr:DUF4260 domain-containing protein [Notoacmeibacter sp.]
MHGYVEGAPKTLLRIEGLAALALAAFAYWHSGAGWSIFALLFLAPDLAMTGYLAGPRAGAVIYNVAHTYAVPLACIAAGMALSWPVATHAGLIWAAHVGFDRFLGYGLKYGNGFGFTHLGLIGRARREPDGH